MNDTCFKLLEPGKIGRLELKNRIILAPMGTIVGNLGPRGVEYFIERARGGVGMLMCNIVVSDYFEDPSHSIFLNDKSTPYFKELCERAHALGSKVCAQLHPGNGRIGGPSLLYPVPISASACPWMHAPQVMCHELTVDEIHRLEDDFRSAAERAVGAGCDAIEIHAYGGYLTDQFLTKRWNKRTDEYGGDLDGRMRFLKELIAISKEVGGADFPVIVKYCPDHFLPVEEGYRGIEEGLELTRKLIECGVDALHVDAGSHDSWYLAMPPDYIQEMTLQARSAKAVKEISTVPVLTHGRYSDPEKGESVLRHDVCDFTVIGRGLLADPEIPNKLAEGRAEDIRPCISCNEGCIARSYALKNATCAVNPICGHEIDGGIPKAKTPLRVLVVGAGPGGCTAALYAKEAGHEVELWERSASIGGNALAASMPYFKTDMHALMTWYKVQLIKAGVPVRYGREANHDNISAWKPDRIIWAAGGAPIMPKSIPGLDGYNVYSATDALRNLVDVGESIVMVGGGMVGIEAALHFDRMGKKVTVIEMANKMLPQPMFKMNGDLLRKMMRESNITFRTSTKLLAVDSSRTHTSVTVEGPDGQESIDCDTVLMALGFAPTGKAAKEALSDICPVISIGDATETRKILYATTDAYNAVLGLENPECIDFSDKG